MADEDVLTFHIEGKAYTLDDLTFREQLALRPLLREIVPDELDDPPIAALVPAAVCVIHRRSDPDFTIDMALDQDWSDLEEKKNGARPTRRGKKAATSGSQSSTP